MTSQTFDFKYIIRESHGTRFIIAEMNDDPHGDDEYEHFLKACADIFVPGSRITNNSRLFKHETVLIKYQFDSDDYGGADCEIEIYCPDKAGRIHPHDFPDGRARLVYNPGGRPASWQIRGDEIEW